MAAIAIRADPETRKGNNFSYRRGYLFWCHKSIKFRKFSILSNFRNFFFLSMFGRFFSSNAVLTEMTLWAITVCCITAKQQFFYAVKEKYRDCKGVIYGTHTFMLRAQKNL